MLRQFDLHDIAPTPWKNGRGLTQELLSWPLNARVQDFQWRISVATISASGPFSVFEGVDRTILLLDGGGIRLRTRDDQAQGFDHTLDQPYRPFRFRGEHACECELLGTTSRDFNVMASRAVVAADVKVSGSAVAMPPGDCGLIFVARGSWSVRAHQDAVLGPESGLCWAEEPLQWTATPLTEAPAVLIAVRIFERAAP